ncbi:MAG: dependent oxidoreductase [Frankiales bacterium]|nr:dependent oxidoreductase [Frankiales bacterium]
MTTAVVGAGPVGLVCAQALARRGEQVLLVDPETGPAPDGTWKRRGVMQFHHPHFFRHLVRMVLEEHAPQMWDAVVASGCVVNAPPPGVPPFVTTVAARRSTFEGALRSVAHERVHRVAALADEVVVRGDRVVGLVAGDRAYDVDRVLVAAGRSSRLGDDLRPEAEGGPCGQSYVSRTYRARAGVEPLVSWAPLGRLYDGYLTIVFPQDAGTLSALVVRPSDDKAWSALWDDACFDRAAALVPHLAPWTDPERFEPMTPVWRGGTLTNSCRRQGTLPAGLFFVGDSVCTTNPAAGRGVSLGLLQAGELLRLLALHLDPRDCSAAFDAWCLERVKPWFDDHVARDVCGLQTADGAWFDPDGPLTSDVYCAAAEQDPSLLDLVSAYQGMVALPDSLQAGEQRVRELLRTGWRPRVDDGPSRDELVGAA